jgi:hypothetical protein
MRLFMLRIAVDSTPAVTFRQSLALLNLKIIMTVGYPFFTLFRISVSLLMTDT